MKKQKFIRNSKILVTGGAGFIGSNLCEGYKIFACNGILFNHESPIRGETYVIRKITRANSRIGLGLQDKYIYGI